MNHKPSHKILETDIKKYLLLLLLIFLPAVASAEVFVVKKDKNTEIAISTLAVKLAGNMVEKENLDTTDILYLYVLAIFSMINQK